MNEEQKISSANTAPLPDMLQGLLSNPEMLKTVGNIIGAMAQQSGVQTQTAMPNESKATTNEQSDGHVAPALMGGDGLASLLSDPTMLEKLPQIISTIKPLLSSIPPPALPPTAPSSKGSPSNRDNLLLALKPFLSPERREAVDSIIRISKLGTVFQHLK